MKDVKNITLNSAVELQVELKNPQHVRAKLEDVEGTSHLIEDDVIYTERDGIITAISIWARPIVDRGARGVEKIIITNGAVNVYIREVVYTSPQDVLDDVRIILNDMLGRTNAGRVLDTPFYTLNIK